MTLVINILKINCSMKELGASSWKNLATGIGKKSITTEIQMQNMSPMS